MNYNDENLLDMVELYAAEMGYIASEDELSEIFDEQVAPMVVEQYGPDDEPAMSEAFNNWSDSLCKEGEIHPEQYSQYCYVGNYS
jgi:hypothetical protein